jgi:RNA polymerase sigma factor (TIGR02999 family)
MVFEPTTIPDARVAPESTREGELLAAAALTRHRTGSMSAAAPPDQVASADAPAPEAESIALWRETRAGDEASRRRLLALCYGELRRLARRLLAHDSASAKLQPTELANEVALRVLKLERMHWNDRAHFLATAATIMRQALIDEVRRFRANKRQAPPVYTTLFEHGVRTIELDIERLDASLRRLAAISPERARLVELRFFVGLTIDETAEALGSSSATVKRSWDVARAWLQRDMRVTADSTAATGSPAGKLQNPAESGSPLAESAR